MWMFLCELGLSQENCEMYALDNQARGAGCFAGCPSCQFRIAADEATQRPEEAYQTLMIIENGFKK